jgi:hypothetical protein
MKTINLELAEDTAREVLENLERKHGEIMLKAEAIEKQMDQIKKGLGITRSSSMLPNGSQLIVEGPASLKTPHGRIRKGQSENLIADFLKKRNGTGATIKEITAETGTVYGTTRRVLQILQNQNRVSVNEGLWKWIV